MPKTCLPIGALALSFGFLAYRAITYSPDSPSAAINLMVTGIGLIAGSFAFEQS